MNPRSLTFRLVSWYCGLLLMLGVAFAIYTYASFDRYIVATTRSTLAGRAEAITAMSSGLLGDKHALSNLIEDRFAPEAQERFIRIVAGGKVIYESDAPVEKAFNSDALPVPSPGGGVRFEKLGNLFLLTRDFSTPGGQVITVQSGQSAGMMETARAHLMTSLLESLPVFLIFAAGSGYMLMRRALTPVEAMIQAAEALTFNSPRNRLPLVDTGDRIDALGRTLNRMLERLDNAYQHASRFSADAAHELRTPLTIMRGELELLATRRGLSGDIQAAVANIMGETLRLSAIVDSLIAVSQLDSISGKRAHRLIDLRALANETIDQIRLLADEKNITLTGPAGAPVVVAGDRDRVKQIMVNLLDNAIKYTPTGGQVTVTVVEEDETAIVAVADTGVGISPENLPLIFDRFFRASTDRGEVGAGLGLAIVRAICAAHGGEVLVDSTLGVGSVFRIKFPRTAIHLVESENAQRSDVAAE